MYVLYVLCFTHRHFFVDNSSPKEKEQRANEVKRMRTSICPSYTRCCFVHFANWCLCVSNWEWQGMIASLVTAAVSMSAILFLASKLKCPLPWDWERMTHCRNVVKCGWDVNDVPAWWQWKFFALFFFVHMLEPCWKTNRKWTRSLTLFISLSRSRRKKTKNKEVWVVSFFSFQSNFPSFSRGDGQKSFPSYMPPPLFFESALKTHAKIRISMVPLWDPIPFFFFLQHNVQCIS